jgi:hypothetical protein
VNNSSEIIDTHTTEPEEIAPSQTRDEKMSIVIQKASFGRSGT